MNSLHNDLNIQNEEMSKQVLMQKDAENKVIENIDNLSHEIEVQQNNSRQILQSIKENTAVLTKLEIKKEAVKDEITELKKTYQEWCEQVEDANIQRKEYSKIQESIQIALEEQTSLTRIISDLQNQLCDETETIARKEHLHVCIADLLQTKQLIEIDTEAKKNHIQSVTIYIQELENSQNIVLTKLKDMQEQEAEYEDRKNLLNVSLLELNKQADSVRQFIQDSTHVQLQNEKLNEEKGFLNDQVTILSDSKKKLLEETSECNQEYDILQAEYEAMVTEKTILDDVVKSLHQRTQENALDIQEIQNTKESLTNLNTAEITLRAQTNNLNIEIQQCIELVKEHTAKKDELEMENINLVSTKAENIKVIETMSLAFDVKMEQKQSLDDEIQVLMIQVKELSLSEQVLINTQKAISVLTLEILEKNTELNTLKISQEEILKENDENARIVDALKIEQESLQERNIFNDNKMSELLLLIQEQQLKKQRIDDDVDDKINEFDTAVELNHELRAEHQDILHQHNVNIDTINTSKNLLLQEVETLTNETVNLHENINAQKTQLQDVELRFEESQKNYFLYKNKLLIVDAYAANIENVVRMISTIENDNSDSSCGNRNNLILAEIISCIANFLEWFESVFVYKLHHLSNLMLHSQIEH